MIHIFSNNNSEPRDFTSEEIKEVKPIWQRLTERASDRTLEVASYYGELDRQDPEWSFLEHDVNKVMQDWASRIRRLGGVPRELWTITWTEDGHSRVWRLNPKRYALRPDKNN